MKYLLGFLLLLSTPVMAELTPCTSAIGQYGNLSNMRYQIGFYKSSRKCFISIGPNNRYPEYRSFNFDSKGELMVFNSLGAGRPSTDTGARNYFFPVITEELMFELDTEKEYIRIQATDGRLWTFDARSGKISDISQMNFVEDPQVTRTNNGGLELTPMTGEIIDEGWRLGGPPNIVLSRKSIIKNSFSD